MVHDHGGYRHAPLSLNNLLNYAGTDRGDTFGAQREVRHRPGEVDLLVHAASPEGGRPHGHHGERDGLVLHPGRTTLIPPGQGGAADIVDYDDTKLTTVVADLAYAVAKAWTLSVGYAYEKYSHADAFSDGTYDLPAVRPVLPEGE